MNLLTPLVLALAAFSAPVFALNVELTSPAFGISVPDIEQFELGPHPNANQPSARLFGQAKDGTMVSVLTPTASADSTPEQCASWLAGSIISRYVPALSSLQIVKASEGAYVLVFSFKTAEQEQLKAFVVTGNGKGHCLEVHMSRMGAKEEQRAQWLQGFRNVAVRFK